MIVDFLINFYTKKNNFLISGTNELEILICENQTIFHHAMNIEKADKIEQEKSSSRQRKMKTENHMQEKMKKCIY